MYRVLVFGLNENPGGVESFLFNYFQHVNKEKIQFDFLCNTLDKVAFEDECCLMGARFFHISSRSKDFFAYKQALEDVFKKSAQEFDAIWVNVCSAANIDYLKIAKKFGIKRRIIHSHNSKNMDSWLRGLLHKWNRKKLEVYATDYWACSKEAASWFYDQKLTEKCIIIKNAIDTKHFRFDEDKRIALRKRLGFEKRFIIGNIGRLHFQKNQSFMLDIMKNVVRSLPDAVMILVGQGEDEKELKEKAEKLGLKNHVVFAGVQNDICRWLSAFDLFLFPSVFEGLGIAALEAQANGVPVLASAGVIPEEVKINDNFVFYDLLSGADKWAGKILEMKATSKRVKFEDVAEKFAACDYDIVSEALKLEDKFLS